MVAAMAMPKPTSRTRPPGHTKGQGWGGYPEEEAAQGWYLGTEKLGQEGTSGIGTQWP